MKEISFSSVFESDNRCRQQRWTALKNMSVSDSQLVENVGETRMTFLWRPMSALGEASRRDCFSPASVIAFLLDKKAVGHLAERLQFTQSPFIFVPICHPHFTFACNVRQPYPTLPPLFLCQLLLNQIRCRCVSSLKEDSLLLHAHKLFTPTCSMT